jgi:hypothetical protein
VRKHLRSGFALLVVGGSAEVDRRKITIGLLETIIGLMATGSVGLLAWTATTLYNLNAQVQVMSVHVAESRDMIKPLWEDYIRRTAKLDTIFSETMARK